MHYLCPHIPLDPVPTIGLDRARTPLVESVTPLVESSNSFDGIQFSGGNLQRARIDGKITDDSIVTTSYVDLCMQ